MSCTSLFHAYRSDYSLVQLAGQIPWEWFEDCFGELYCLDNGRTRQFPSSSARPPAAPVMLIADTFLSSHDYLVEIDKYTSIALCPINSGQDTVLVLLQVNLLVQSIEMASLMYLSSKNFFQ